MTKNKIPAFAAAAAMATAAFGASAQTAGPLTIINKSSVSSSAVSTGQYLALGSNEGNGVVLRHAPLPTETPTSTYTTSAGETDKAFGPPAMDCLNIKTDLNVGGDCASTTQRAEPAYPTLQSYALQPVPAHR
jgi:hypothetical protein